MNQRTIVIALAAVVLTGGLLYLLTRPPEPVTEVAKEAPAPRAPVTAAPKPEPPATAPAAPRRPRTVAPEPSFEAPAPAPVDVAPEVGTLQINSDVPGAQVFIDRQFVGATPVTANNVKPGSHQLNVSMEGYDGIAQTIDVEPGPREITVNFKQVRLDAKIDVIHKHRMGSCKGRLVATPTGMRYETTDKDDAFTVALPDLEMFQVDYLEKNLKVKPRKGKQYNFTDPDGNADRLFVFHRDVEKAREKMRKAD